eukprot:184-Amorphochlora_amoeboformis.AAC.1
MDDMNNTQACGFLSLSSAGHRADKCLAAYGAFMSRTPFANEQGRKQRRISYGLPVAHEAIGV